MIDHACMRGIVALIACVKQSRYNASSEPADVSLTMMVTYTPCNRQPTHRQRVNNYSGCVITCGCRNISRRRIVSATALGISHTQQPLVQQCSVDNWRTPLRCDDTPGEQHRDIVVALGKFDAMHIGHRSLAIKASENDCQPVLLSFSGMAEVLGWPSRLPLVALQDRARVLTSWAQHCNGRVPRQRMLPFQDIRSMSPEEFVAVLARDLGAAGIVAGRNYRFGYRAAGDATALQELGKKYGMRVHIVDLIDDSGSILDPSHESEGHFQVSSSKIREYLSQRNVQGVKPLLGRTYRVVAQISADTTSCHSSASSGGSHIKCLIPSTSLLNLSPAAGSYVVEASIVTSTNENSETVHGTLQATLLPPVLGSRAGTHNGGLQGVITNNDGRAYIQGLTTAKCTCVIGDQGLQLVDPSNAFLQAWQYYQAHSTRMLIALDFERDVP